MSVRISKEFGVNPSVTKCVCCGKEYGVALLGTSYKDKNGRTAQAPPSIYSGLCDDCGKVVHSGGLMVIEVRDGETDQKNPYRTGRIIGIKKEAKERMFKDVGSPIVYMEHSLFEKIFGEHIK